MKEGLVTGYKKELRMFRRSYAHPPSLRMAPLETLVQGGHGLTSPTFDRRGRLLVASGNSGEVHQVVTEGASSTLQTIFNTGGPPTCSKCRPSRATACCLGRLGRTA